VQREILIVKKSVSPFVEPAQVAREGILHDSPSMLAPRRSPLQFCRISSKFSRRLASPSAKR